MPIKRKVIGLYRRDRAHNLTSHQFGVFYSTDNATITEGGKSSRSVACLLRCVQPAGAGRGKPADGGRPIPRLLPALPAVQGGLREHHGRLPGRAEDPPQAGEVSGRFLLLATSSSASDPASRGVDVLDESPPHSSVLRRLSSGHVWPSGLYIVNLYCLHESHFK